MEQCRAEFFCVARERFSSATGCLLYMFRFDWSRRSWRSTRWGSAAGVRGRGGKCVQSPTGRFGTAGEKRGNYLLSCFVSRRLGTFPPPLLGRQLTLTSFSILFLRFDFEREKPGIFPCKYMCVGIWFLVPRDFFDKLSEILLPVSLFVCFCFWFYSFGWEGVSFIFFFTV